ncbi:uncharacterized protein PGTG_10739 [Puccinia graminis f. sp. tritici CRL 75-36-700-3]|uniref:Uncharacterized protein n=1 Tax=Puccinia graminis f. sp. tritici (strain CRL 75-36-700-3 / race SCCL) TaxID=418459 RepID=E3KJV5_PUCGT|nr:uncharacterized protein PGTG_10739 [Puccinia graminis f. sp. tritici CRL 75-36-700-3]EFP84580.1 hypothetical protein PGTG_10739 [Puccinia graminis f. sp. tritici CRL 75-36-700-3]
MHAIKSIFILLTLKFALVSACDINYRHTCELHDDRPGPRESPIVLRESFFRISGLQLTGVKFDCLTADLDVICKARPMIPAGARRDQKGQRGVRDFLHLRIEVEAQAFRNGEPNNYRYHNEFSGVCVVGLGWLAAWAIELDGSGMVVLISSADWRYEDISNTSRLSLFCASVSSYRLLLQSNKYVKHRHIQTYRAPPTSTKLHKYTAWYFHMIACVDWRKAEEA